VWPQERAKKRDKNLFTRGLRAVLSEKSVGLCGFSGLRPEGSGLRHSFERAEVKSQYDITAADVAGNLGERKGGYYRLIRARVFRGE
jgi:hypothetical protein